MTNKVIVINGFTRGGSNVLWNIFQSHPMVCSPIFETGQILGAVLPPRTLPIPFAWYVLSRRIIRTKPLQSLVAHAIKRRLHNFKLKNVVDSDNRFKYEGIPYRQAEIEQCVLCTKSLNRYVLLNDLFADFYEDTYFVGLIRNGYALCNGWKRRGEKPERAGLFYRMIGERMLEDQQRLDNYIIIKFEDILTDPFGMAYRLYDFAQLEPKKLEKLRLQSKKVLTSGGKHKPGYGKVGRKYWFDALSIHEILVPNISAVQAEALSDEDRKSFEKEAGPILDIFGYRESHVS